LSRTWSHARGTSWVHPPIQERLAARSGPSLFPESKFRRHLTRCRGCRTLMTISQSLNIWRGGHGGAELHEP
jgi:hypothetical protein